MRTALSVVAVVSALVFLLAAPVDAKLRTPKVIRNLDPTDKNSETRRVLREFDPTVPGCPDGKRTTCTAAYAGCTAVCASGYGSSACSACMGASYALCKSCF